MRQGYEEGLLPELFWDHLSPGARASFRDELDRVHGLMWRGMVCGAGLPHDRRKAAVVAHTLYWEAVGHTLGLSAT
jgi:hypothetical protein